MKLTTKQVCEMLGVTPMTVWQYRRGTPTKSPLPYNLDGRNVIFDSKQTADWAKQNSVPIVVSAGKLTKSEGATARKTASRRVHRSKPS